MSSYIMRDNPESPIQKKRKRPYRPRHRTAPHALLLALLESEKQNLEFLNKVDLCARAQKYADETILNKKRGGRPGAPQYSYDGWGSMGKQLIGNGLVKRLGNPARFSLTDEGREVAHFCEEREKNTSLVTEYNQQPANQNQNQNRGTVTNENGQQQLAINVSAIDEGFILMVNDAIEQLREEGHDHKKLKPALGRVLKSKTKPKTVMELRVAILGSLGASPPAILQEFSANGTSPTASQPGVINLDESPASIAEPVRTSGTRTSNYEMMFILDSREKIGRRQHLNCDKFAEEIRQAGVPTDIRTLPAGDALFVRKCKTTGREEVLNFIAERKTADDFSGSVKDGRIFRQAYSMQNSRITRRAIIVEGKFDKNYEEMHLRRLEKTLAELESVHGFSIFRTKEIKDTVAFYRNLYRSFTRDEAEGRNGRDLVEFEAWSKQMDDFNTALTVEELFFHQMCQVPSVGKKAVHALNQLGYSKIRDLKLALAGLNDEDGPIYLRNLAKAKGVDSLSKPNSRALYNLFKSTSYVANG